MYSPLNPRKQELSNSKFALPNSPVNRVTLSYASALILIALLSLFSYVALNEETVNQRRIAVVMNAAGQQRMFSQRIALLSLQLVQSPPGSTRENLRTQLLDQAAEMGTAHTRLIDDNPDTNLSGQILSPEIRAMYFDPPFALDTQVADYLSSVQALVRVPDPMSDDIHLSYIVNNAPGLLSLLDTVVNQYTAESIATTVILEQREFLTFISILGLLLIVGWFIFRPMERQIRQEHLKLTNEIEERKQAEAALQRSQALYRTLIKNLPDMAVILYDRDLRYLLAEGPFLKKTGYSTEELESKLLTEVLASPFSEVIESSLHAAFEGEMPEFERQIEDLTYSARVVPISDPSEGITSAMFVIQDITQRKLANKEMRESEERFRTLVTYSPVGIIQTDAEGECIFVNQRWSEITGFSEIKALGSGWTMALHPDDRDMVFAVWLTTAYAEREFNVEYRFQKSTGETIWVLGSIVALRNADHVLTGYFGTIIDITDRKTIESQLSEREQRFRQLAENIDYAFWMIKPDFTEVLYISPAYEVIWGQTCESMYANPLSFLDSVHPEDREQVITERVSKMMSGHYNIEYRVIRPDGEVRWVHSRAFPVIDEDGQIYRIAGISEDITDRKKAQQQAIELHVEKEKVHMLSDFITNTSHELRTPLSTISTSVYLAQRQTEPEKQRRYFEMIETRVWQLNRLIDQLHMMAKLDSSTDLGTTSLQVNQIIENVKLNLDNQATAKQIHITLNLQPQLPAIQAHYEYIHHAIENLLENAILYTSENGTITIRTFSSAENVAIEIRDSGVGINSENVDRIFDRFYKINEARTGNNSGAGLGLTMVKKIVELHQGRIEVESVHGEGSVFRLHLPIHESVQESLPYL